MSVLSNCKIYYLFMLNVLSSYVSNVIRILSLIFSSCLYLLKKRSFNFLRSNVPTVWSASLCCIVAAVTTWKCMNENCKPPCLYFKFLVIFSRMGLAVKIKKSRRTRCFSFSLLTILDHKLFFFQICYCCGNNSIPSGDVLIIPCYPIRRFYK